MNQTSLFDSLEYSDTKQTENIVIRINSKKVLTKPQQNFNRLIKKIETLRQSIEEGTKVLDENLAYYSSYIRPLEIESVELRKGLVKELFRALCDKKLLSVADKKLMRKIISVQLRDIFQLDQTEPDDEIKKIFKRIEGVSYDQAAQEDFDSMRDEMEEMFKEAGLDVDFNDMNAKMSEEDMARKMKEIQEKVLEQKEEKNEKRAARKKTKKQIEQEAKIKEMEDARKRNIGSIYKQLAKVLHPDLEKDEHKKVEKKELMQQLVAAYNSNDLHALLHLEMQWIHKEENNLETLSEEKMKIYIQVLKDQVDELEFEKDQLYQHPKYNSLNRFKSFLFYEAMDLPGEKKLLESLISSMRTSFIAMQGKGFIKEIKTAIAAFKVGVPENMKG